MSYALICHMRKHLKDSGLEISLDELKEELLVYSTIVRDRTTQKLYGIPSKLSEAQKQIYKIFKIKRSECPYSL